MSTEPGWVEFLRDEEDGSKWTPPPPERYAIIPNTGYPAFSTERYYYSRFTKSYPVPRTWRSQGRYVRDLEHPLGGYDDGAFTAFRRINLEKVEDRYGDRLRVLYRFNRPEDEA